MTNDRRVNRPDEEQADRSAAAGYQPQPQKEARLDSADRDAEDELALVALNRLLTAEESRSGAGDHDPVEFGESTETDHAIAVQIQLHEEIELKRESIARDAALAAQLEAQYHNTEPQQSLQPVWPLVATTSHQPVTQTDTGDPHWSLDAAFGDQSSNSQALHVCARSEPDQPRDRKRQRANKKLKKKLLAEEKTRQSSAHKQITPSKPLDLAEETPGFHFRSNGGAPSRIAGTNLARRNVGRLRAIEPKTKAVHHTGKPSATRFQIVLDTNIMLAHLHFLRHLLRLSPASVQLLIPKAVLFELDVLKTKHRDVEIKIGGQSVKQHMVQVTRDATNWLLEVTRGNKNVIVQRMEEETQEMSQNPNGDVRILAYALNLAKNSREQNVRIALFSNDNILRLNAHSEGILALSVKDVRGEPAQLLATLRSGRIPIPASASQSKNAEMIAIGASEPTGGHIHTASTASFLASNHEPQSSPVIRDHMGHVVGPLDLSGQPTAEPRRSPTGIESFASITYWPLGRLIARSNPRIGPDSSSLDGPDEEFRQYSGLLEIEGDCQGCKFKGDKTIKTPPALAHHSCATCLEVVCKGCWKATGCTWDCTAPFDGEVCGAMTCCESGRAVMLYEILCQLDSCSMSNNYRISLKTNPSSRPVIYQGDRALIKYLVAITQLLPVVTTESDNPTNSVPHRSLKSMLLSSTLLEVLCRLLTLDPLSQWPQRSEIYHTSFNLIQRICLGFPEARAIFDHRLVKSSTCGLRAVLEEKGHIRWSRATSVGELRSRFLSVSDLQNILHGQGPEEFLDALRNKPIKLALYDVLRELFMIATRKMEGFHARLGTAQARSSHSGEIEIVDAILDLATGFVQMFKTGGPMNGGAANVRR
ncbi:hypothetical protein CROQUDRAFT_133839 [Cronartium quercuum f. sp. fusiforme G11]|uniref:PIN domain-containing protein n=1 Tax=Cronartium quercuum f. sp. fusiforme G11 TaxID=708437 RepID=A0A9P6NJI8_9BASI|nr:hypothetical protein CROQUDRAFT_133839 [Cronartium quercuum f. sp. fusiforme G11]